MSEYVCVCERERESQKVINSECEGDRGRNVNLRGRRGRESKRETS